MIHVIPSFHYDVAYLKTYEQYLPQCFANIDQALFLLEKHPDYTYLLEQVILLDEYWQRFPMKRDLLKRFAGQGRLEVAPGMWVMPDMNHCDGESMFLQVQLGKQWLKEHLEIDPKVCWIADCWGHHAQLPQILRACGYEYYVFWRCMRRDVMKNDFVWRGLDGTTMPAHWLARGYSNLRFPAGGDIHNILELNLTGCGVPEIRALTAELGQYGPVDELLVCNGGDMVYPQGTGPDVVKRLNATAELGQLVFSTPSRLLDRIDWPSKPVFEGEFNSAFQGTFTTNIRIKQLNRALTNRMLSMERLAVVLNRPIPVETRDAIWKLILKQQFHDIICGTITDEALQDCYREFDAAAGAIDQLLIGLSDGTESGYFNPLPWARTASVIEGARAARIELPALGFGRLVDNPPAPAVPDAAPVAAGSLPHRFNTPFYQAELSAKGYLTSLTETKTGRQLVRAGADAFGGLGLQVDNGDSWLNWEGPLSGGSLESALTQNTPDPWDRSVPNEIVNRATFRAVVEECTILPSPSNELIVRQRGKVAFWQLKVAFETTIHLSTATPRIEYETGLQTTGQHYRVRVGFPSTLPAGRIRHEIPFGVQTRPPGEHVALNWAGLDDEQVGLALLNAGTPASNACDGILMLTLFRSVAMEYKTESRRSFADSEQTTFRYAILPHPADESLVVRQGQEFNFPPVACNLPQESESDQWQFPESIRLGTLRDHAPGILLRLFEGTGKPAAGTIAIPKRFSQVATCDGTGRPVESFVRVEGSLGVRLGGFEIKTFLLK